MSGDWLTAGGEMAARIRAFDWSRTPLGAIDDWPQSLKSSVGMMLSTPLPMVICWGPDFIQVYNDTFARVVGPGKHPANLGMPTAQAFPESWPFVEADLRQVKAGGPPVAHENWAVPVRRNGKTEESYWTYTHAPIHEPTAAHGVGGVLVIATETTATVASLLDSEARCKTLFETMDEGFVVCEFVRDAAGRRADLRFLEFNAAFERLTGWAPGDWTGRLLSELLPDAKSFWVESCCRMVDAPAAAREPSTGYIAELGQWYEVTAFPFGEGDRFAVRYKDVTARRRADEALRESEERLRLAVDVAQLGAWDRNVVTGDVAWSEHHNALLGYQPGELTPTFEAFARRVHPEDRPGVEKVLAEARDRHRVYAHRYRIVHPSGEIRWMKAQGLFFYDENGAPVRMIGVMQDVTEEARAAEHQATLLAELQHRTRNLLGVIRSVARRTAESSDDLDTFLTHFDGRLAAIARTQSALTRNNASSASLEAMILEEFLAAAGADQVTLKGPEVQLKGKSAESLSLAVHELVTNALKYGALTKPKGHVEVTWVIESHDAGEVLVLDWRETGVGVMDMTPKRAGFGRRLLERALPYELGAKTSLDFAPGGLHARIATPLPATETAVARQAG